MTPVVCPFIPSGWFRPGLAFIAAGLFLVLGCSSESSFQGTELVAADPGSAFHLQDQFGGQVELADLAGKVVVLTFLYTHCPDVCPLTTDALRKAYDSLGQDASDTAFVAITVDPARDTVEQVYRYSEQRGMLDKWAFLTGSQEELAPVWRAYYIPAEREVVGTGSGALGQLDQHTAAEAINTEIDTENSAAGYLVGHSAPVYLIDRAGRLRVVFTGLTLDPQPLVHDIRMLLK